MTTPYVQPDFTLQDAATYKANIDQATASLAQLAINFLAHEEAVPVMAIRVEAGRLIGSGFIVQAAQSTGTITAPSVNPRIDRIGINTSTGAVEVITGVEDPSPVAPDYTAGRYPICQVLLATSTTSIVNSMITDERPLIQAVSGATFTVVTQIIATRTAAAGEFILADTVTVAANMQINLPGGQANGAEIVVKKIGDTAHIVTVDAFGGFDIDEADTFVVTGEYQSVNLVAEGNNWWTK